MCDKIIICNKLHYDKCVIEKTFVAGIILNGWEVKGVRKVKPFIKNSFIQFKKGKFFLVNSIFFPYLTTNNYNNVLKRNRELLFKKSEIIYLKNSLKIFKKIFTFYVSKLFWKNNFIKVELLLLKNINKLKVGRLYK